MRATIRLENLLSTQTFDHRATPREAIVLPIVIVVGGTRHNALMCNLSTAGAMIATSAHLTPRMRIEFQCGTICANGTVVWQRHKDFGIRFDNHICERQLNEQLSRSNAVVSWQRGRLKGVGECGKIVGFSAPEHQDFEGPAPFPTRLHRLKP